MIITGLTLILSYVIIAKKVFESDKISYVFETQGAKLSTQKREIEQSFERALLSARSLVATYDPTIGALSKVGEQIFQEEKNLLALELVNENTKQSLFRVDKKNREFPMREAEEMQTPIGKVLIFSLSDYHFLITLRYQQDATSPPLRLRSLVELNTLLPAGDQHQTLFLLQNLKTVSLTDLTTEHQKVYEELLHDLSSDPLDRTQIWKSKVSNEEFLISTTAVSVGDFRLVAVTPLKVALGALETLFNRSLLFLLASFFSLIAVALVLARTLTQNLAALTASAEKIGAGDFDHVPDIRSHDEMDVLAKAFQKMVLEIKRLLLETRDKARMEAELKTAKLVQEQLLPQQTTFTLNDIDLHGVALTSTECGGDWWHYFQNGDDLYIAIADATGHGTPAALITAAARSVFSRLEQEALTINEMMCAWDLAVSSCSQGRVYMTGLLFKLNTKTGQGEFLGAGHESPYLIEQEASQFNYSFLVVEVYKSLGDGFPKSANPQPFLLSSGASLILYTDGLFSIERPDGKKLSEKRFGKTLVSKMGSVKTAEDLTKIVLESFEEHRQGLPLPDDITLVSIRRASS